MNFYEITQAINCIIWTVCSAIVTSNEYPKKNKVQSLSYNKIESGVQNYLEMCLQKLSRMCKNKQALLEEDKK